MTTSMHVEAAENTPDARYNDPIVQGFHGAVIRALEDTPDGASAAAAITGEFHRYHAGAKQRETALTRDVRRLSADEGAKATMLAHVGRSASRQLEEILRQAGQLHHHQENGARFANLAAQLDEQHPSVATQIREILDDLTRPEPPAVGTVVLASAVDQRWSTGWFQRSDRGPDGGPLEALPFAGWVLVADGPFDTSQTVQAAFLLAGQWWTKGELEMRGMRLARMD